MRVVARLTGLAPDTIRAWERRYSAVTPERTDGGTRRYSTVDVRRLTMLKELIDQGYTISGVASLDEAQLTSALGRRAPGTLESVPEGTSDQVALSFDTVREAYLSAIARLDTRRASEILLRTATLLDPRDVVFRVVVPIIQEVGQRWSHAEIGVAQEHLVSAQLRGLAASLLRLSPPDRGARRVMLTTPAGHPHEFGILCAALLAGGRGFETVYLGPDLPDSEIEWAVDLGKMDLLVLSVVSDTRDRERARLAETLERVSRMCRVWIGLPEGHSLVNATPFAQHFHTFEDMDVALANWGG